MNLSLVLEHPETITFCSESDFVKYSFPYWVLHWRNQHLCRVALVIFNVSLTQLRMMGWISRSRANPEFSKPGSSQLLSRSASVRSGPLNVKSGTQCVRQWLKTIGFKFIRIMLPRTEWMTKLVTLSCSKTIFRLTQWSATIKIPEKNWRQSFRLKPSHRTVISPVSTEANLVILNWPNLRHAQAVSCEPQDLLLYGWLRLRQCQ